MKRVILLCVFLIGMIGFTFAQTATVTIPTSDTYVAYNTDATVAASTTVWFKVIGNQHVPCTQDLIIHLDSISGGTHATTVKLYGTKFGTTYAQIGSTITWVASTADTTIILSNATATRYRDYKIEVVNAAGDVTKIDYWKFKLYRE
jgi:hypothetical protein